MVCCSSHPAPDHANSGDLADAGILLHVQCGCHRLMQAEPVALEPAQMAHMIVYPVPTEPLAIGVLLTSAPWTMR